MNDKTKMLDWVEKAGVEAIKQHHQSADEIKRDATTTLTVLLAGGGAALAYGGKALEGSAAPGTLGVVALLCSAWLFGLCVVLVLKCLSVHDIAAVWNEPANLYHPQHEFDAIREAELKNMQARLDEAAARNTNTSAWLNRVRLGAIATPLIALAGAIISWLAFSS